MSGHGQHDDHAGDHAVHNGHHDETTSDDFPADEPRSPGWLPLLGGALLLAGVFGYMVFGSDAEPGDPSANAEHVVVQPVALQPDSARRPPSAFPAAAAAPPNRPRPPSP